ncbi:TRADD-N-associated membrane domain-containing protein [Leptolyngbya ectocarpi]|uniref:TRADD-N-associated membrane domain-containing protein n=1 Tax=Leptolyngbya ectocarpi TaxID=1202 RepID=UPI0038991EB4
MVKERLRQAKVSFNIALLMSIATTVAGGALLLSGKVSEGFVTSTTGGITSSICWFKLTQDANDRLDKLTNRINSELPDESDHT